MIRQGTNSPSRMWSQIHKSGRERRGRCKRQCRDWSRIRRRRAGTAETPLIPPGSSSLSGTPCRRISTHPAGTDPQDTAGKCRRSGSFRPCSCLRKPFSPYWGLFPQGSFCNLSFESSPDIDPLGRRGSSRTPPPCCGRSRTSQTDRACIPGSSFQWHNGHGRRAPAEGGPTR